LDVFCAICTSFTGGTVSPHILAAKMGSPDAHASNERVRLTHDGVPAEASETCPGRPSLRRRPAKRVTLLAAAEGRPGRPVLQCFGMLSFLLGVLCVLARELVLVVAGSRAAASVSAKGGFMRNEANQGVSSMKFEVSSEADFAKRSQFRGRRGLRLGSFVQMRLQERGNAELRTERGSARWLARQTKPIPRARESLETADWVRLC